MRVVIAHDEDQEDWAEQLAAPLRDAGYAPLHLGTVLVGESMTEQAGALVAAGAPVLICATRLAMGSEWPKRLAFAARDRSPSRVRRAFSKPILSSWARASSALFWRSD